MDNIVVALYQDMQYYFILAEKAIQRDDMDLHFVYGGQYHRTADRILEITGIDPRPEA